MTFKVSLFKNKRDVVPELVERTWNELCVRFAKPMLRADKDGLLFSPATFSPAHRLNLNVTELSLLVLDCDHDVEFGTLRATLRRLDHAFAIYSTHSHRRVTDSNPDAEARFRVVIPLAEPIPAGDFPKLWQWATSIEGMKADAQAKDVARIYYTPAKWSAVAPYQFHIEQGAFLNWRALPPLSSAAARSDVYLAAPAAATSAAEETLRVRDKISGEQGTVLTRVGGFVKVAWDNGQTPSLIDLDQLVSWNPNTIAQPVDFVWHEDRHEELCRRIRARGKRNGRGNYDAKCLAHSGKGTTSLCYFPHSGSVVCNARCDYFSLLRAEGLSDSHLPSHERAALRTSVIEAKAAAKSEPHTTHVSGDNLSAERLHVIYGVLLAHLLYLTEKDEQLIYRELRIEPYGTELIAFPNGTREPAPIKLCSMPTLSVQSRAVGELSKWFDLTGVPGFFRTTGNLPQSPNEQRLDAWRINLPYTAGLLAPYDNGTGYIIGIRIFLFNEKRRNVSAPFLKTPFLLSSRGLPLGAKAVRCREEIAA
jgi:hypothetical protein